MEDEEEGNEEKSEKPSENEVKTLTILKALPACNGWRQVLNLLEEVRQ